MDKTEYIWLNGELLRWEDAKVHVLTHTLHYGGGAFEGMRAYKTDRGTAIFRLDAHWRRLYYSASVLQMQIPYSREELTEATCRLLRENRLEHGYIRPLVYYGYGVMGLNPRNAPVEVMIACWPWGCYLPHEMVDLKVSRFARIHPGTLVADAKVCGHYVNSILAVLEIRGTHYHEALLLDTHGNIAEGPGENIFFVKSGRLFTPKLGTILAGITRATVIELARDVGLEVVERDIVLSEALAAEEAFYTGTAAEITPIRSIDDKLIGKGESGPVTKMLKAAYSDLTHGKNEKYSHYLTYI